MDRLPNELLLHIFDDFSFNELRAVVATCSRWRALRERCRGFWADIQTPKSLASAVAVGGGQRPTLASELACLRISRTNGQKFTLHLRGLFPGILAAVAQHLHHVEHLKVELTCPDEMDEFVLAIRSVRARHLVTLSLRSCSYMPARPLPHDLFSGMICPVLTSVCLVDVTLPTNVSLPCFSAATNVRYWPTNDFFFPNPPDFFTHFPSMRSLSLRGYVDGIDVGFTPRNLLAIGRFRIADWSRIERLELLDGCWELALYTSWPLAGVPHIVSEHPECETFPFIAPGRLTSAHIVFEDDSSIGPCLRLGNDDWTFSRTCSLSDFDLSPGETKDGFAEHYYNFHVDQSVDTRVIQSATVAAGVWELCACILGQVANLKVLRVVLEPDGALPNLGYGRRILCADLTTLILRADGDPSLPTRVSYEDAAKFAMRELRALSFPLQLHLENIELVGERGREFATCFNAVAIEDAGCWSYLTLKARNPWTDA
ncbi:hypothetical protein AURDEDRAFT_184340 [Auricularia subglabra TFB-10046 SS5]|nr:hypothetical protein AURDEDRAFT_184340 [Auricularia subglabra TFB-10046 SS5]